MAGLRALIGEMRMRSARSRRGQPIRFISRIVSRLLAEMLPALGRPRLIIEWKYDGIRSSGSAATIGACRGEERFRRLS
jgi:hypothetical protein